MCAVIHVRVCGLVLIQFLVYMPVHLCEDTGVLSVAGSVESVCVFEHITLLALCIVYKCKPSCSLWISLCTVNLD